MSTLSTLATCAGAGLVATLAIDVPMALMPEGFTPAAVTAGRLRGRAVDEVSAGSVQAVHHATGLLGGVVLGFAVLFLEPTVGTWAAVVTSATVLSVAVINGFGFVVLPFAGLDDERRESTFLQWLFSATVYGVALTGAALYALGA